MKTKNINIQYLKDNNLIIFESIMGSQAYGTSLPTSDTDIRGVFILEHKDILGNNYIEQVSDKKNDIVYYEIRRFLELLQKNNPTVLELLFAPTDCILYKDPIFDILIENRKKFITKKCKYTFGGYANQQIQKAKGYNKKINWEESDYKRKTVLDFCYIPQNGKGILFKNWLEDYNKKLNSNYSQKDFGLANIDHIKDLYAMYNLSDYNIPKGILSKNNSEQILIHSIPKNINPVNNLFYNKDAYSMHCRRYKEYQIWLKERNEDRFKMNKNHGKNYDSKNMSHCIRLIDMSLETAKTGNILVRRPLDHIKLLMSIRRGEFEYNEILDMANKNIKLMDDAWNNSNFPNEINSEMISKLLIEIRKKRYNLK